METEDELIRLLQGVIDNPEKLKYALRPLTNHVRRMHRPLPEQSAAIALRSPKTAALFFDRVWAGLDLEMPASIGFWSRTSHEMALLIIVGIALANEAESDSRGATATDDSAQDMAIQQFSKQLAEAIRGECRRIVVPVYATASDRDIEYQEGDRSTLVAVVEGLQLVSERGLTWPQVSEVRTDEQAARSLRRMRHWLDREMIGKSRAYVEDEIAIRIDDYDQALKKHGLASAVGTLATTLDSKVLLGGPAAIAALSFAGEKEWALLAGAAIVVGKAAVHVAEKLLAYREVKEQSEVCFLAQLRDR